MVRDVAREQAAPHARGSTLAALVFGERAAGCPACAGIDPRVVNASETGWRLPRMRGDRPDELEAFPDVEQAAPHARGSTRVR